MQPAALEWVAGRRNWNEVLVVPMHLSLNPRSLVTQGVHRLLPQANALNAWLGLYVIFVVELQKANVVGNDFNSSPGQSRNQSRLASTGRADKGNAPVRKVNGRRMERRNSALMTQHPEGGTEQIGTDFAIVGGWRRVD